MSIRLLESEVIMCMAASECIIVSFEHEETMSVIIKTATNFIIYANKLCFVPILVWQNIFCFLLYYFFPRKSILVSFHLSTTFSTRIGKNKAMTVAVININRDESIPILVAMILPPDVPKP